MAHVGSKIAMDEPVLRHMGYDFVQIDLGQTVGQALASIRHKPTIGRIIYFYVVDLEGRLCSVVPTRRLLLTPLETPIEEIMVREVITIPETKTVLDACELFTLHRLLAFPIVDHKGRVVGIVDVNLYTERLDALEEAQRSEDLFQLIGVHLAESQQAHPIQAFRSGFPWLLCNIAGGIAAALISGLFQQELERVVALALFVPVVLGLAESVGIQSVSLTLSKLRGQPLSPRMLWSKLRRERFTGAMLGLASAAMVAALSLLWLGNWSVAACQLAGFASGVTVAALLGMAMPNLLRLLNRNAQVAAGPIALACADMASLVVYFSIARWIT